MNKRQAKIALLRIKLKRLHKAFIVSRETSILYRSKATRSLKAVYPAEYKLILRLWGQKMAETKKAKAKLKAVCDELRALLPAKFKKATFFDGFQNRTIFVDDETYNKIASGKDCRYSMGCRMIDASNNHLVEYH